MNQNRWRALLLALCALGIVLTAADLFDGYTGTWAQTGLGVASADKSYLQKVLPVAPDSAAAQSGLRAGDVLDLRPMSVADRYRLYNSKYMGQPMRVYVVRRTGLVPITVIAKTPRPFFTWDVWLGYAGGVWMLIFTGILAIRRPESRDARLLALLLIGFDIQQALAPSDWITPWAEFDAVAAILGWLSYACLALLATYSLSFARPPSLMRQVLAWISYAVALAAAAVGVVSVVAECTGALDPSLFTTPWTSFVMYAVPFAFPLFCGLATAVETRGIERTRYLWAFVPLGLFYAAGFAIYSYEFYPQQGQPLNALFNVAIFLAPLGLTYSLLNRRLLDIGFALNRAAIFSVVSLVLVGTFVLVEWALSDWLQLEGHSANIAISAALALGLGLSMRFVHGRVEHFVDHVMFRKRRDDEEAIRRMAREAPYITDRATLLARAEQVLLRHADASSVNVLLDNGRGWYGTVNEDDPALVSLRAEHTRVDLHALETSIAGEWAYPMVARGRLVGTLVLGPKRSQESYAPDESSAIAQLAHSLGTSLEFLYGKHDPMNDISKKLDLIIEHLHLEGNAIG